MACETTHRVTSKTQGPGLCCSQIQSGALAKAIGSSVLVTTATGKCGHCSVRASTSTKPSRHGRPVLRFTFGGSGCPSAGTGCCALTQ
jgi:hypothetical protein